MVGHEGMPFEEAVLNSAEGAWLLECVYTPVETELVSTARRRGMQTITGDRYVTTPTIPCQCRAAQPILRPKLWMGCLKSADNPFVCL